MKQLDASTNSELNWDKTADSDQGYFLDFSWESLDPFDTATYNCAVLSIEEFSTHFPLANKVVLGKFRADFPALIRSTETFEEKLRESGLGEVVFRAEILSEYLHRLASFLPETAQPTLLFDFCEGDDLSELMLLICRRRFEHFHIEFVNEPLPIQGDQKILISLPQDERYDPEFFRSLYATLDDYKCIPEEFLNEHWDEVAEIYYDPETIGELGKRMLLGFEAAGGLTKKAR